VRAQSCRLTQVYRVPWQRVAISSSGQIIAATTMYGLHLSTNQGATFTKAWTILTDLGSARLVGMSFEGQFITVASGGRIWISRNFGANWSQASISISFRSAVSLAVSDNGQYQVVNENGGPVWLSSSYGQSWTLLSQAATFYGWQSKISSMGRYVTMVTETDGYALGDRSSRGNVWFSSDFAASFQTRIGGLNSFWWKAVSMSQTGQYAVAVGGDNPSAPGSGCMLFVSSNFGVNWTSVGPSCLGGLSDGWWSVSMSGSGRFISATMTPGKSNNFGRIFVSSDFGATWSVTGPARQQLGHIAISAGSSPCSLLALVAAYNISGSFRTSPALDSVEAGVRVNFSCFTGNDFFQLDGPSYAVCYSNGTFVFEPTSSGPSVPTCLTIRCSSPPPLSNGTVAVPPMFIENATRIIPGASAQYTCVVGQRLVGVSSIPCTALGTWSGTAPLCVPSPCPSFGYDGRLSSPNCTCAPGYVGCAWERNTGWTDAIVLSCLAVSATTSLNVNVVVPTTVFNSSRTVICPLGYTLNGVVGAPANYTTHCGLDGAPNQVAFAPRPNCTLVACPAVGYVRVTDPATSQELCVCVDGFAACSWVSSTSSWTAATECQPGFYANNNSARCLPCPPQSFSARTTAAQCTPWKVCGDPFFEYELVAPTTTSDRMCRLYDFPPVFPETEYTITISQQASPGDVLRFFVAEQVGPNTQDTVLSYSLVDPLSTIPFLCIDARSGELRVCDQVPKTNQYQYSLLVQAMDNRTFCYRRGKPWQLGGCFTQVALTVLVAAFTSCPFDKLIYISNSTSLSSLYAVSWDAPQTNEVVRQLALDPAFGINQSSAPGDLFPLGSTEVCRGSVANSNEHASVVAHVPLVYVCTLHRCAVPPGELITVSHLHAHDRSSTCQQCLAHGRLCAARSG
jgi:hypothetical protein